jgi:hypothetical protein
VRATGPYLLTQAVDQYQDAEALCLEPASRFYPIHKEEKWEEARRDPNRMREIEASALAVHLWWGSWWKDDQPPSDSLVSANLVVRGKPVGDLVLALDKVELPDNPPLISALMVTRGRLEMAKRATRCFLHQTYPARELIIIDDDPEEGLGNWIAELSDPNIHYVRLPDEGRTLGELRNISVRRSSGEYVTQWDDDDLYAPQRLETQMRCLLLLGVDACFFRRETFWWPEREILFTSTARVWENSMLCRKDKMPLYPEERKGEDTHVTLTIALGGRIALLDTPQLYAYGVHQTNTFQREHFEAHLKAATEVFQSIWELKPASISLRLSDGFIIPPIGAVGKVAALTATGSFYPVRIGIQPHGEADRFLGDHHATLGQGNPQNRSLK